MSKASAGPGDDSGTAQHQAGDVARRMFEDSATGMVLGKKNGKIVEANPAFRRILGYTEAGPKELTVFDLTHADDPPGMKERRKAHFEDNVESLPLEKPYLHKDGHTVWARRRGVRGPGRVPEPGPPARSARCSRSGHRRRIRDRAGAAPVQGPGGEKRR